MARNFSLIYFRTWTLQIQTDFALELHNIILTHHQTFTFHNDETIWFFSCFFIVKKASGTMCDAKIYLKPLPNEKKDSQQEMLL